MKAYHGKESLKQEVLAELQAHYEADNFIQGDYWDGKKGCAVGCLLKSEDHIEYEKRFGIPIHLARLEDCIFEGLPIADSKRWPLRFMDSFEVGKDYSSVVWDFLRWLLLDFLLPKIEGEGKDFDDACSAIRDSSFEVGKDNSKVIWDFLRWLLSDRGSSDVLEKGAAAAAAAAARDAARAAETAAEAATWYAARDAAKQKQLEILKEYFNER